MKIIRLKFSDGIYLPAEQSYGDFGILAGFLTDDACSYSTPLYRQFIYDSNRTETGGNYSIIEKENNNVLIGCVFDDDPFEPAIKMTQQQFLSILDQWEELIKLRPKEIIIFKRGDSYILEGRNTPSKE
ncbi:MAG TPA: hypothetical protein VGT41_04395 [Candidatus Babeliales bacterium]|nr:hypothetical protein [Candidatus Babeliales bacterium]